MQGSRAGALGLRFRRQLRPGPRVRRSSAGTFRSWSSPPKRRTRLKVARMRAFGAEVRLTGRDFDAAKESARAYAAERKATFVEDGRDPAITEGAGTIAIEILRWKDGFDAVLIPLGNGALLNGVGTWLKAHSPATAVIGVGAAGAPSMERSFRAGKPLALDEPVATIADGVATRVPVPEAVSTMLEVADDVLLADEEAIVSSMRLLFRELGLVVEGAGAVTLAAASAHANRFRGQRLLLLIGGGNLDERGVDALSLWRVTMGEPIRLRAADGHELGAYRAGPSGKPRGGIVVLQEIFGVNSHIRDVADGFAADGYLALAPALYDRSSVKSVEMGYTNEDIARGRALREEFSWEDSVKDVEAAMNALRGEGLRVGIGRLLLGRVDLVSRRRSAPPRCRRGVLRRPDSPLRERERALSASHALRKARRLHTPRVTSRSSRKPTPRPSSTGTTPTTASTATIARNTTNPRRGSLERGRSRSSPRTCDAVKSRQRTTKTEASAGNGMVTAMHPLAAEAGVEILKRGGNAVDAAIATALASGVVEPFMSGLGGTLYALVYDASSGDDPLVRWNRDRSGRVAGGHVPARGRRAIRASRCLRLAGDLERRVRDGIPLDRGSRRRRRTRRASPGAREAFVGRAGRSRGAARGRGLRRRRVLLRAERAFATPAAPVRRHARRVLPEGSPRRTAAAAGPRSHAPPSRDRRSALLLRRSPRRARRSRGFARTAAFSLSRTSGAIARTWAFPSRRAIAATASRPSEARAEAPPSRSLSPSCRASTSKSSISVSRLHVLAETLRVAFQDRFRYLADPAAEEVPLPTLVSPAYAAERRRSDLGRRAPCDRDPGGPSPQLPGLVREPRTAHDAHQRRRPATGTSSPSPPLSAIDSARESRSRRRASSSTTA